MKTKSPNKILDGFQKLKKRYLNKLAKTIKVKIPDYHTVLDSQEILSWDKKEAENILKKLKAINNLDYANCSFCIKNNVSESPNRNCKNCTYGKRHKICSEAYSDIQKILDKISIISLEFKKNQQDYLDKWRNK